jgi:hypothetical protein
MRVGIMAVGAVLASFSFAQAAPPGMAAAATVDIPAGGDITTTLKLPPGTLKVGFSDNGSFYCKSVKLVKPDGSKSNPFTNSDMTDKAGMTTGNASGFVAVEITCHGGAKPAQLVLTVGR